MDKTATLGRHVRVRNATEAASEKRGEERRGEEREGMPKEQLN